MGFRIEHLIYFPTIKCDVVRTGNLYYIDFYSNLNRHARNQFKSVAFEDFIQAKRSFDMGERI